MTHVPPAIDGYLRWVEGRLPPGLPPSERQRFVEQARGQLLQKVAQAQKAEPGLGVDAAALRVLNALDDPLEADPLRSSLAPPAAGPARILHAAQAGVGRVARAGARGKDAAQAAARRDRRGVHLASLVLALLLLAVAANALEGKVFPEPKAQPTPPALDTASAFRNFTRDVQLTAQTGAQTDSFPMAPGAAGLLRIRLTAQSGCVDLTLRDPAGQAAFSRSRACQGVSTDLLLEAPGTWRLDYDFLAWTGRVNVSLQPVA